MTDFRISDILLLLEQPWIPEEKKEQIRHMILDTIDAADMITKRMKEDLK